MSDAIQFLLAGVLGTSVLSGIVIVRIMNAARRREDAIVNKYEDKLRVTRAFSVVDPEKRAFWRIGDFTEVDMGDGVYTLATIRDFEEDGGVLLLLDGAGNVESQHRRDNHGYWSMDVDELRKPRAGVDVDELRKRTDAHQGEQTEDEE